MNVFGNSGVCILFLSVCAFYSFFLIINYNNIFLLSRFPVLIWLEGRSLLELRGPAAQRPAVSPERGNLRRRPRFPSFAAGSHRFPGGDVPSQPRLSQHGGRDDQGVAEEARVPSLVLPPADGAAAMARPHSVEAPWALLCEAVCAGLPLRGFVLVLNSTQFIVILLDTFIV